MISEPQGTKESAKLYVGFDIGSISLNVVKSSIARASDGVLYTHAGPEIGVAATKTFSAQMAALALLALYLAQIRGEIDEEESGFRSRVDPAAYRQ